MPPPKLCIYCQQRAADSRDHIPPKLLFPKPWPSDLITVPACKVCNAEFGRDDEYLRAVLVMRKEVAEQPASKELVDSLIRSAGKPQARRFSERVYNSIREVDVVTPGGIHLGRAPAYAIDVPRLERSLGRITRGLFYHETKIPLPVDAHITVDLGFERDKEMQADLAKYMSGPLQRTIGKNAFGYTFKATPESPFSSVWLMVFYGVAPYLVLTMRPGASEPNAA